MAIKKSELYSSLWKSCDELRGGMDASQYKDFTSRHAETIRAEVDHYSKVGDEVRLASGDYIDLKAYEPAMRYEEWGY